MSHVKWSIYSNVCTLYIEYILLDLGHIYLYININAVYSEYAVGMNL